MTFLVTTLKILKKINRDQFKLEAQSENNK